MSLAIGWPAAWLGRWPRLPWPPGGWAACRRGGCWPGRSRRGHVPPAGAKPQAAVPVIDLALLVLAAAPAAVLAGGPPARGRAGRRRSSARGGGLAALLSLAICICAGERRGRPWPRAAATSCGWPCGRGPQPGPQRAEHRPGRHGLLPHRRHQRVPPRSQPAGPHARTAATAASPWWPRAISRSTTTSARRRAGPSWLLARGRPPAGRVPRLCRCGSSRATTPVA